MRCFCGHDVIEHDGRRVSNGFVYTTACNHESDSATRCRCFKFVTDEANSPHVAPMIHNDAFDPPAILARGLEILDKAKTLIAGDRHDDYGPADDEFDRIAAGWQIIFEDGLVNARKVALAMIWMKCCRELASNKADNWIDLAGYAGLGGAL